MTTPERRKDDTPALSGSGRAEAARAQEKRDAAAAEILKTIDDLVEWWQAGEHQNSDWPIWRLQELAAQARATGEAC